MPDASHVSRTDAMCGQTAHEACATSRVKGKADPPAWHIILMVISPRGGIARFKLFMV